MLIEGAAGIGKSRLLAAVRERAAGRLRELGARGSELDHRTYVYFHMRERSPLREGEPVRAGDPVGAVGCTGSCWGNHLHFEIREGSGSEGRAIDPLPLLRDWAPVGSRAPGRAEPRMAAWQTTESGLHGGSPT